MTGDELNALVRRIWKLMVARGVGNVDAMEVVLRLQVSVALASGNGDPQLAVKIIQQATADAIEGLRTGAVRVSSIELTKSKPPETGGAAP